MPKSRGISVRFRDIWCAIEQLLAIMVTNPAEILKPNKIN